MNGETDFTFNNLTLNNVIHCTNGLCKLLISNEVQTNITLGLWSGPILLSAKDGRLQGSNYLLTGHCNPFLHSTVLQMCPTYTNLRHFERQMD